MEAVYKFLNRFLPQKSVIHHVSILAGGTALAQFLNIATMPLLSRIYSPGDFGIMAAFASLIAILSETSAFRYYLAIPLPKEERDANALVGLSLLLQVAFSMVLSLVLLFAGRRLLSMVSMEPLIPYRLLIPVGVIAVGTYFTLTQWAVREKHFSTIAQTKVTQSLSGIMTKSLLGLFGFRPLGLLLGTLIGQAGGVTRLSIPLLKTLRQEVPSLKDLKRNAYRYRNFPLFDTWAGLLITLGGQLTPLFLVALFDTKVAGLFAMAQSLLFLPAAFIGQAIGQVFLQRASVARHEGNLETILERATLALMRLGFFPILSLSFFAPQLLSVFLGARWEQAGTFAQIIAPWVAINFVYSPLSHLFSVLEKQRMGLFFEMFHLPLKIGALYVGYKIGNPFACIALLMLVNFWMYFLKINYICDVGSNNSHFSPRLFFKEGCFALALLILPIMAYFTNSNVLLLILSVTISIYFYIKKTLDILALK